MVYGAPALVAAVQHYTEVWFTPMHKTRGLRTAFEHLSKGQLYPPDVLSGFKQSLDRRFEQFSRGELPVQNILQRPDDLAVYTMASLLHALPLPGVSRSRRLPLPGQLSSRSDLPLGAGMGSSAAVIAATFVLYEHLLDHPQTTQDRFDKVRFCERLQHGKGSAIDAAAVVFGGLNRISDGALEHPAPEGTPALANGWYWRLHGIPLASTGECVARVRSLHGQDNTLWQEFAACTETLQTNLATKEDPRNALRENHRLLCHIGVVPEATQHEVALVEASGGAAKISGAGSIRGEAGGIILAYTKTPETLPNPEEWNPIHLAPQGAHLL